LNPRSSDRLDRHDFSPSAANYSCQTAGVTLRGHDQVMQVVRAFWEALPDAKITVDQHFAAGDLVVSERTLAGTHRGTFSTPSGEIPATGNPVTLRYASVKRFREDRLVSEHLYFDQLEFLQQLGVMSWRRGGVAGRPD
jgi:predicted ester cyclase